ncbi:MAG TPA: hypothetical protein VIW27_03610 [Gammaproteobacteria bacterium]
MTNYPEEARKDGSGGSDDTPRRRSTDLPPILDYSTRELVKNIVDNKPLVDDKPSGEIRRKSLLRKFLDRGTK